MCALPTVYSMHFIQSLRNDNKTKGLFLQPCYKAHASTSITERKIFHYSISTRSCPLITLWKTFNNHVNVSWSDLSNLKLARLQSLPVSNADNNTLVLINANKGSYSMNNIFSRKGRTAYLTSVLAAGQLPGRPRLSCVPRTGTSRSLPAQDRGSSGCCHLQSAK